ncbi:MAG TPA: hypothetical protein VJB99_02380 [Patescibacteria group bacterium]|nr:hypothetical protein [Patescibacteria group bacterium]
MTDVSSEPTNGDILEAINAFADATEQRFEGIETRLARVESTMTTKEDLKQCATKEDLRKTEHNLRDYTDRRFEDFQVNVIGLVRKEDAQVTTLVDVLKHRKVLTPSDAQRVLSTRPLVSS